MLLLLFLIVFVAIPIIFKYNVEFQRKIIFPIWNLGSRNFSSTSQYGLRAARNIYVNVNKDKNITLGVWHILPENLIPSTIIYKYFDYDQALANTTEPVIIYLHGNSNFRTDTKPIYSVLRKHFHIIACDYRGYGDSTKAEMNEQGIVGDIVELFKWVKERTNSQVYIWGHSLGTGVGTQTIARLSEESIQPAGLVLEAPFSSVTDVVRDNILVKFFSWLPWFENTIINPLEENGLAFNSCKHIQRVECPIMILHATDDSIIHYKFAVKLYNVAKEKRPKSAGNLTLHLLDRAGYDHLWIYKAKELPFYIENFINVCVDYEKRTGNSTMQML